MERYGLGAVVPADASQRLTHGQKAVLDLILLARAKMLIAPFISVFSRCAAQVGDVRYLPMALDPPAVSADLLKIAEWVPEGRRATVQALIRETAAALKYSARYGDD